MSTNNFDYKLRLLGSYWQILHRLLPREGVETTISWLEKELRKDKSQLSRELNLLKEHGLVDFKLKGRVKIWHLTEEGSIFVSYLLKAMEELKLEERRRAGVEGELWKVEQLLSLIDDKGLSEELRVTFASTLHSMVSSEPVLIVERCESLKQYFKSWIKNPPIDDRIGEMKRRMLSVSMPKLLLSDKTKEWALSMYPDLQKLLNHESLEVKIWAIGLLGDIARLSHMKREITNLFLKMLFDPGTEPTYEPPAVYKGSVAEALRNELIHIFATLSKEEKIELLNDLREKAKSDDKTVKLKAEWMLRSII